MAPAGPKVATMVWAVGPALSPAEFAMLLISAREALVGYGPGEQEDEGLSILQMGCLPALSIIGLGRTCAAVR